jgi:hypothetical protein
VAEGAARGAGPPAAGTAVTARRCRCEEGIVFRRNAVRLLLRLSQTLRSNCRWSQMCQEPHFHLPSPNSRSRPLRSSAVDAMNDSIRLSIRFVLEDWNSVGRAFHIVGKF